jgi:hypothetical protein
MSNIRHKTIIGRAELVRFPELGDILIPAKIDTGADVSSLWASNIQATDTGLTFTLFNKASRYYTAHVVTVPKSQYHMTRIASSFGEKELRYVVKLRIELKGRRIKASFTLSNRSSKLYPILIGRRLLKGKFLVDVEAGEPLKQQEYRRLQRLAEEMQNISQEQENER